MATGKMAQRGDIEETAKLTRPKAVEVKKKKTKITEKTSAKTIKLIAQLIELPENANLKVRGNGVALWETSIYQCGAIKVKGKRSRRKYLE